LNFNAADMQVTRTKNCSMCPYVTPYAQEQLVDKGPWLLSFTSTISK
jgi:hypothetical protein